MKALRPSITQWLPSSPAVVFIIDGSEPAPPSSAGSVMKKAERASPCDQRLRGSAPSAPGCRPCRAGTCCLRRAPWCCSATGPSGDRPDFFSTMRGLALGEVAAVGEDVRRQHAGRARLRSQLRRPVRRLGPWLVAARILLVGDDVLADEGFDPGGDLLRARRDVAHAFSSHSGRVTRRNAAGGR